MPSTPRKDPFANGQIYHVINKSIEGFRIFPSVASYQRMKYLIMYYQVAVKMQKFSQFVELKFVRENGFEVALNNMTANYSRHIQIIAYCLMPTHIHIVVKQLLKNGASIFMANVLNSYARYFNTKYNRKGPLWSGRFKNVLVETDEQLIHLTRYVHLNPTTAALVDKPEEWQFSSYMEYVNPGAIENRLCEFKELVGMKPGEYQKFTNDHKDYQRQMALIKGLALEDLTYTS